jgi:hypothetical protein
MKRLLFSVFIVAIVFVSQLSAHNSLVSKQSHRADGDDDVDEEEPEFPDPQISLNKPFNRTQLSKLPTDVYISQFISFILTGSYTGEIEVNDAIDNNTLDESLDFLLLSLSSILAEEIKYDPEYYEGKLIKLLCYF